MESPKWTVVFVDDDAGIAAQYRNGVKVFSRKPHYWNLQHPIITDAAESIELAKKLLQQSTLWIIDSMMPPSEELLLPEQDSEEDGDIGWMYAGAKLIDRLRGFPGLQCKHCYIVLTNLREADVRQHVAPHVKVLEKVNCSPIRLAQIIDTLECTS